MTDDFDAVTGLRARFAMTGEAIGLSVRSLLDRRLGMALPIVAALLLIALPGLVLRMLRSGSSPQHDPQVVPFVYPLF